MRVITPEELEKILDTPENNVLDLFDKLLPGFKAFVETSPAYRQIETGQTEANAALSIYAAAQGIHPDVIVRMMKVFTAMTAVGYYMRELEGERVPTGATVH